MRRAWRCLLPAAALLSAGAAQAVVKTYTPGSVDDPALRAARFLGEDKRHYSAVTELLRLQGDAAKTGNMPADYWWLLADNYLGFGLRDRAEKLYTELAVTAPDPLQLAQARLKLARFEYERGYLPEARATLLRMREDLPEELLVEWQDLLARVLMTQGRNTEAIQVLTEPKNGGDQTPYTQYNLGIALIGDGRVEQGRTALDRVGRGDPVDRDSLALLDRANMTLGWHFLQNRQGGAAKPVLRRVRVEGPYSNRALLGLGWAELAPEGGRQRRDEVGDGADTPRSPFAAFSTLGVLLRRGMVDDPAPLRSFRRSGVADDDEEALQLALQPWLTLIDRDPQDPAVQEGWLAIPYALDQLGAHDQARQYYEQAVERLEAARVRTQTAMEALKTNRMVETIVKRDLDAESGWNWELKDLPDAPETYYLQTLLAEHRFAEALKNYRDVRLLARNLDAWQRRLDDMEKAYQTAERGTVDPRVLFARAKENYEPPRSGISIKLAQEINLSEPGRYRAKVDAAALPPPSLKLADPPQRFVGTYERIVDLRKRLDNLRPQLATAGNRQGQYLQRIASAELQAQKTLIEKYLVEARFALARLYDRQLTGADPDEYEIKK